jgi:hypothetical protein
VAAVSTTMGTTIHRVRLNIGATSFKLMYDLSSVRTHARG